MRHQSICLIKAIILINKKINKSKQKVTKFLKTRSIRLPLCLIGTNEVGINLYDQGNHFGKQKSKQGVNKFFKTSINSLTPLLDWNK